VFSAGESDLLLKPATKTHSKCNCASLAFHPFCADSICKSIFQEVYYFELPIIFSTYQIDTECSSSQIMQY